MVLLKNAWRIYLIVYYEFEMTNFVNNFYLIYFLCCFINTITFAWWIYWDCSNLLPNDILTTLGWLWSSGTKRLSPYIIGGCIITIVQTIYKIMYLKVLSHKSIWRQKIQNKTKIITKQMKCFLYSARSFGVTPKYKIRKAKMVVLNLV